MSYKFTQRQEFILYTLEAFRWWAKTSVKREYFFSAMRKANEEFNLGYVFGENNLPGAGLTEDLHILFCLRYIKSNTKPLELDELGRDFLNQQPSNKDRSNTLISCVKDTIKELDKKIKEPQSELFKHLDFDK